MSEHHFIPPSTLVFAHPLLKNATVKPELEQISTDDEESKLITPEAVENEKESDFLDPLGVASSTVKLEVDMTKLELASNRFAKESPKMKLSNTLAETNEDITPDLDPKLAGFRPWSELKEAIMEHFTTLDTLTLETSFLESNSAKSQQVHPQPLRPSKEKSPVPTTNKLIDLAPDEYQRRIRDLRKFFLHLWSRGQRIDGIRLITEVARILQSTTVPHFYPTQFVLVTDFLDLFGKLVYERLLAKAKQERLDAGLAPLPTHFVIHDILEQTRITTRNWFGKIQDIKELVPRIYIEAALLRCMKFMDETSIFDNVMRLCVMAQKIQHPLISAYARCYICRVAMRLNPVDRAPHWKCLNDWMQTYSQQPVSLIWPALEYVIQCVSFNAVTYDDLSPLWEYAKIPEKRPIILKAMLNGVSPLYWGEHAMDACRLVTTSETVTADEVCAFGRSLNKVEVAENVRKPILRAIWKSISNLTSLKAYMACCDIWIEFAAKYFTVNELHIILEAIIQKLTPEKKFEAYHENLVSILRKIVDSPTNIAQILNMEIFPHFLDILQEEHVRRKSSTLILSAFVIGICKRLHDSISVYSPESEVDDVSILIKSSLDRFYLNDNPEHALDFLVGCRGALMNIDQAQKYVVQRIISLTLYVVRKAKHSSSRSMFLQACLANLFITIPSLGDPVQRLQLAIQSAQVALAAQSFLQVNAFVDYCLERFSELPPNLYQYFSNYGCYFLSFLIMVPEMNEETFTFSRFLDAVKNFDWLPTSELSKGRLLLSCFQYLCTRSQLYRKTTTNSFQLFQFQWMNISIQTNEIEIIGEKMDEVSDLLRSLIRQESNENPQMSMGFLEMISILVDGVSHTIRSTAKDAYKKCKLAKSMEKRLDNLCFED